MQTGAVLFGSPLGPRSPQTIYHPVYNVLPLQQRFSSVPAGSSSARPLYLRFAITNTPVYTFGCYRPPLALQNSRRAA